MTSHCQVFFLSNWLLIWVIGKIIQDNIGRMQMCTCGIVRAFDCVYYLKDGSAWVKNCRHSWQLSISRSSEVIVKVHYLVKVEWSLTIRKLQLNRNFVGVLVKHNIELTLLHQVLVKLVLYTEILCLNLRKRNACYTCFILSWTFHLFFFTWVFFVFYVSALESKQDFPIHVSVKLNENIFSWTLFSYVLFFLTCFTAYIREG